MSQTISVSPERAQQLRAVVAGLMPALRADLESLVRIPSISTAPAGDAAMSQSAEAVAALFEDAGLHARIVQEEGGHPAVLARREGPAGAPRVLLYAHHDVQPIMDESAWETAPFEPQERDGRLYGRGTSDDKAGIIMHLAAIRALGELPVTLTVIVEGEEEVGSESLPAILSSCRDELDCDVIVLADSGNWAVGTPSLTTTLRGNVRAVVTVATLDHGVHSGMFGGVVPDATTTMCRLLARLHDEHGSVAIPDLLREPAADLEYVESDLRRDSGLLDGVSLIGTGSAVSRLWTQPSLTVVGIDAPAVEGAANLLSPTCRAALSLRIAPNQDPEAAFAALKRFLETDPPFGAHVTVELEDAGSGFQAAASGPYVAAARTALESAWGSPAVDTGIGGSIPFIAEFAAAFPDAAILVTGPEDPDTRAHGANESQHLGELERACVAEAILLDVIGSFAG